MRIIFLFVIASLTSLFNIQASYAQKKLTITSAVKKSYNGSDISCASATDAQITVTATGGTGNKNFQWAAPGNETTSTISNKGVGTYSVTVTDQGTCSVIASYIITQPAILNANLNYRKLICFFDNTDTIRAKASGGNPG